MQKLVISRYFCCTSCLWPNQLHNSLSELQKLSNVEKEACHCQEVKHCSSWADMLPWLDYCIRAPTVQSVVEIGKAFFTRPQVCIIEVGTTRHRHIMAKWINLGRFGEWINKGQISCPMCIRCMRSDASIVSDASSYHMIHMHHLHQVPLGPSLASGCLNYMSLVAQIVIVDLRFELWVWVL